MKKFKNDRNCSKKPKKILSKRKKIFHNSLSLLKFKLKTVIAPHNTTQFLIKNNSTPFFSEDDIELVPSSMIVIDDEKFLFDFSLQESVSTAEESDFNNKEKNYPKEWWKIKIFMFVLELENSNFLKNEI